MPEKTYSVAKIFQFGDTGSLVVVIPKELRELLNLRKGQKCLVNSDGGRVIYEPI